MSCACTGTTRERAQQQRQRAVVSLDTRGHVTTRRTFRDSRSPSQKCANSTFATMVTPPTATNTHEQAGRDHTGRGGHATAVGGRVADGDRRPLQQPVLDSTPVQRAPPHNGQSPHPRGSTRRIKTQRCFCTPGVISDCAANPSATKSPSDPTMTKTRPVDNPATHASLTPGESQLHTAPHATAHSRRHRQRAQLHLRDEAWGRVWRPVACSAVHEGGTSPRTVRETNLSALVPHRSPKTAAAGRHAAV